MWALQTCLSDRKINRLLQIRNVPNHYRLDQLLTKPAAWEAHISRSAYAIANLRHRVLEPIPPAFSDRLSPDFFEFRSRCLQNWDISRLTYPIETVIRIVRIGRRYEWLTIPLNDLAELQDIGTLEG